MHRNVVKAVLAATGWNCFTHPNPPTNLATKGRTEAPQAIATVDLLTAGGLTLSSYCDSPTSFKVRTYVHLILWFTNSTCIFAGLSTESVPRSWDLMETDAAGMDIIDS